MDPEIFCPTCGQPAPGGAECASCGAELAGVVHRERVLIRAGERYVTPERCACCLAPGRVRDHIAMTTRVTNAFPSMRTEELRLPLPLCAACHRFRWVRRAGFAAAFLGGFALSTPILLRLLPEMWAVVGGFAASVAALLAFGAAARRVLPPFRKPGHVAACFAGDDFDGGIDDAGAWGEAVFHNKAFAALWRRMNGLGGDDLSTVRGLGTALARVQYDFMEDVAPGLLERLGADRAEAQRHLEGMALAALLRAGYARVGADGRGALRETLYGLVYGKDKVARAIDAWRTWTDLYDLEDPESELAERLKDPEAAAAAVAGLRALLAKTLG